MLRFLVIALLLSPQLTAQTWNQWGGGPRHTGSIPVYGQTLREQLADVVYDPFVAAERAEGGGSLLVHYQTPLSDGNDVFMMTKGGSYTGFRTWETQIWGMRKFQWVDGQLVARWAVESDWNPVPSGASRFEPVFHGALANGFVYLPGRGGTVLEVDRATGAVRRRLGLFGLQLDPTIYVTGPITVSDGGILYYNTLKLPVTSSPWAVEHQGAWLVKITPDGTASRVSYATLVPGAPAAAGQCTSEFPASQLPWPSSPNAVAPTITCGSQRPGLNVAPAVAPDGTIYTVSRTHFNARWGWLVAVNPDLTPKWASSLRNRFHDGCNVLIPPNGSPGGCRSGATTGVDPADNQPGSGVVNDNSSASPVVAPDGSVYIGTWGRYNHSQGHTARFSAAGEFLSGYPFGWDVTPALWEHDGTFSLITKENRYVGVGSYCGNPTFCPPYSRAPGDQEGYYITQLSPELEVEWTFRNTETLSCARQPDGSIDCVDDQQNEQGFEWCVNAPAVDARGVVYVNSEDGHLYAINQGGTLRERLFLQLALGAAYTPLSIGADGKIYTQNAGHLFVVGTTAPKRRAVSH